ncbi:Putative tRNA (cytidine(34)-2'-O)-methyltransferase [Chlamydiales bacterium SCGC AG-110-M15]|nr:Putative tRNA (cytidine(34)-2'-O)-methyltransferase [Chlamydiales bacterium SCGC AG-110-M15]
MPTIVLYQPQIPQNAGNIVRTCSVTGFDLLLVHPLGFSTDDRYLKRAGLDYWDEVKVNEIKDLEDYLIKHEGNKYFYSSHSTKNYSDVEYEESDLLIFGSETSGLPDTVTEKYGESFLTLPMQSHARCLNLSNAVAVVVYESWRQRGFM